MIFVYMDIRIMKRPMFEDNKNIYIYLLRYTYVIDTYMFTFIYT